ncbi:efflux RND transporter periplasmic adaptor subunit [uncultured Rubinisphaera sp.]|uniref:efflux RND transporter periplasmic adaptor subunit n=1 Tax=uncultured Rubinisphaera sp. TaxID=1678686 RepID=UPI0030DD9156
MGDDDHEEAHGHEHENHGGGHVHAVHKIIVSSADATDITSTQRYVCQIHSRRHIEIRALEGGYLEEIPVKEGQAVKKGDTLFNILVTLYKARLDSDIAEAQLAQIEYNNTQNLVKQGIVSDQELALAQAKLAKAQAKVQLAKAEMDFTNIKAPFDGIIDRLHEQHGSLIEEGDVLTTLSDNSVMWVYFNVPEARYLDYQSTLSHQNSLDIDLMLANGKKFEQSGRIGAIEADFNNETGNIAFRADFPNPAGLLRHGQTGTVLIHRIIENAIVIPQRATYEILAKRYVYVVDEDKVIHQREIEIETEQDDIFVIKEGLAAGEKIVLEGVRQVRDGDKVDYEYQAPEEVLGSLKYHAE